MCRRVTCSKCGKQTWYGCGSHIEQVLKGVSEANRCTCRSGARSGSGSGSGSGPVCDPNTGICKPRR